MPDTHGGRPIIFSNEQYFLVFQMQNLMRIMLEFSVDVLHVTICYILDMNNIAKITVGCTGTCMVSRGGYFVRKFFLRNLLMNKVVEHSSVDV